MARVVLFVRELQGLKGAFLKCSLRTRRREEQLGCCESGTLCIGYGVHAECKWSVHSVCAYFLIIGLAREHAGASTKSNPVEKAVFVLENHEIKVQK